MTDVNDINPRAVMGDNAPDFAAIETDRLQADYADLDPKVTSLLEEARAIPNPINTRDDALAAGALVKRMKDVDKRLEEIRNVEGEPHLRRTNAVNGFFFALRERLGRRSRNDRPGAADVLQARINDYQDRIIAAERAERERIAAEERRKAQEAQRIADEEARKAREAEEAAARARKPETKEEKGKAADAAHVASLQAETAAAAAVDRAQEAHIATLAKSADLVRDRGDDGVLLSSKQEPYALVEDEALLDKEALWPFISIDAKEKALRAWAKNTGHNKTMAGASIGKRNRAIVR